MTSSDVHENLSLNGMGSQAPVISSQTSNQTTPTKPPTSPRFSPRLTNPLVERTLSNCSSASTISRRRRQFNNRRHSSTFDFPHSDAFVAKEHPSIDDLDLDNVPWWTSQRFRLSILCFFGFVVLYAQRVNLSIAIVCMSSQSRVELGGIGSIDVNSTSQSSTNYTSVNVTSTVYVQPNGNCPMLSTNEKDTEFHWSKSLEGLILGAFYWGYLILQVPGGRLAEKIGAKRVIALGMFPVAVLNILSPFAARVNPYLFIVLRVVVGLGEGVMYPAVQALWAKWAPPNERSRLIGFSYAGGQLGNALVFPIGGFLCSYGFDGGWASVFYVIGSAGLLWCVMWMIFATDTPEECTSIGELEKKYITMSLKGRKTQKSATIPWKAMLCSRAVWAIVIGHMCGNYGAYMLLSKMPAYMKEVLKFDIKSNGAFSMLPYLAFWFFITLGGTLADGLIEKQILSIGWTRKLMSVIGTVGPAMFLLGTGYMDCNQQTEAVVMLTLAVGLCGFHFSGFFINHGDIAPPFAGTLFGITNTAATIPGILSPYIVSAMTPNGTQGEWQQTFYVAAAIYCTGALSYVLLGSGEVQPWAKCDVTTQDSALNEGSQDLQGIDETEEEC